MPTDAPLTIDYKRRKLTMHQVTSGELDAVASLNNAVNLGMFGISFGAFVSLVSTLLTVPIANPVTAAAFAGSAVAAGLATAFFGVRAIIEVREARQKLRDLKRGDV
jgi:hypothetical protein